MKKVRLNLTESEKLAQNIIGLENEHINFNMSEGTVDQIIQKEKKINLMKWQIVMSIDLINIQNN